VAFGSVRGGAKVVSYPPMNRKADEEFGRRLILDQTAAGLGAATESVALEFGEILHDVAGIGEFRRGNGEAR
jgi:hypothetical protein